MRKLSLFLLLLFILANASAQKATDYRKQQNYKEWVHIAPKFDDDFFKTEEAYTRCRGFDAERARTNRMDGWEEYYQEDMK